MHHTCRLSVHNLVTSKASKLSTQVVMQHTANSNHSEAAVLELNKLAARERVGVLAATEGVEACRVLQ